MEKPTLTADMPIQITSELRLRITRGARPVIVKSVPVTMFTDAHERQSMENHHQTLERIRQRGGFDAGETVAVLSCLPYQAIRDVSEESNHRILYEMIAGHNRGMRVAEKSFASSPLRDEVAKLYCAAGCNCCRDDKKWEEAAVQIGEMLDIPRYDDGSGYNFFAVRDAAEKGED